MRIIRIILNGTDSPKITVAEGERRKPALSFLTRKKKLTAGSGKEERRI